MDEYFFVIGFQSPIILKLKEFFGSRLYLKYQNNRTNIFDDELQTIILQYQNYHRLKLQSGFLNEETYAQIGKEMSEVQIDQMSLHQTNPAKLLYGINLLSNDTGLQILDYLSLDWLLKTLPKIIRDKVKISVDSKNLFRSGALNKIHNIDANFQALKFIINYQAITEIITAAEVDTKTVEFGIQRFFRITFAAQREKDIQSYLKNNPGLSKPETDEFIKKYMKIAGKSTDAYGTYGWTLSPDKSPTGNLRCVTTNRTGEAASVTEEAAVVSAGHELCGHGFLFRKGLPREHGKVSDKVFEGIEIRTQRNYKS